MKKLVIFDLDGTLRNNAGSSIFVPKDPSKTVNWILWQSYVMWNSPIIPHVVEMYKMYVDHPDYCVQILTASTFGTEAWLANHGLPFPDHIEERPMSVDLKPIDYKKEYMERTFPNGMFNGIWIDDDTAVCNWIAKNHEQASVINTFAPY